MSRCPDIEQIEELTGGRLGDEEACCLWSHLGQCAACRKRYEDCLADEAFAARLRRAVGKASEGGGKPRRSLEDRRDKPGGSLGGDKPSRSLEDRRDKPGGSPGGDKPRRTPEDRRDEPGGSLGEDKPRRSPVDIEGYEVIREIRRGGQGVVYEAWHEPTRRRVALKVMLGGTFASEAARRRFEREIELAAGLRHPHIVAIHDCGRHHGDYYFSMDYIEGVRLDEYVRKVEKPKSQKVETPCVGGLSLTETLRLFIKVCHAVNYAHQRGIIHRDLTPSNILVDAEGEPHILDFGLAKHVGEQDDPAAGTVVSMPGQVMGTVPYMSPEQTRGRTGEVDIRTDVYSLGVILYELLTGRYPYEVVGPLGDVLRNITEAEPQRPSLHNRRIDDEIETIVLKALNKDRERRYQTAGDLARDLERYLAGETIEAKRDSTFYVFKKTLRRYRVPVAITAAFLLVVLAALGVSVTFWGRAVRERGRAETARAEAEWQSYRANLGAAEAALRLYDIVEGELRLQAIPEKYRSTWECRHLHSRLDQSLATFSGNMGPVLSVAFSPDGKWLAWGSEDGIVRLRELDTGQEITANPESHKCVVSVAFSPDGARLASAGEDRTVRLWDPQTGELCSTLSSSDPEDEFQRLAFSPDGRLLAAGCQSGRIVCWNLVTGQPVPTALSLGQPWPILALAFTQDGGSILATGGGKWFSLWDVSTGRERRKWYVTNAESLAMHPRDDSYATGHGDGTIRFWRLLEDQPYRIVFGHKRPVNSLSFSADGSRLASGSQDKTLRLWDTTSGESVATFIGHTGSVAIVAFSPEGTLIASGSDDGTVKLWNAVETDPVKTLRGHAMNVEAVAFSPDGKWLASAGLDFAVKLWDVFSGSPQASMSGGDAARTVPFPYPLRSLAFFPDGQTLVASMHRGGEAASVLDTRTRKKTWALCAHEGAVLAVAVAPDGRRVATAGRDGTVRIWDSLSHQQTLRLEATSCPTCVTFSPDGNLLAAGGEDGTIGLWVADSGAPWHTLKGHELTVRGVSFNQEGTLLASASDDRLIKLWDPHTGRERLTLEGHNDAVRAVAFSPDGTRLVSGSGDSTLKIWDVASGQEIITLWGHRGPVQSVAFSPDGQTIASGSADDTVMLWERDKPQIADLAQWRADATQRLQARQRMDDLFRRNPHPAQTLAQLKSELALNGPRLSMFRRFSVLAFRWLRTPPAARPSAWKTKPGTRSSRP